MTLGVRRSRLGIQNSALASALAAALLALVLAAAGCGEQSSPDEPLSAQERAGVESAGLEIADYCRQLARHISRRGRPPSAAATGAAGDAANEITALARRKPLAEYRPGQTMRQLIGDTAEDLEGSNCTGPLLDRLEQAFSSLPPEP